MTNQQCEKQLFQQPEMVKINFVKFQIDFYLTAIEYFDVKVFFSNYLFI